MNAFEKFLLAAASTLTLVACDGDEDSHSESAITGSQLGPRPFFLVDDMAASDLKTQLEGCDEGPFYRTDFSIGHRGAPMQFPEHTVESYEAAEKMGAGILECDVAFTSDEELVCRHSQCDLHTTTNILVTDLASKCSVPFTPYDGTNLASATCCTSDITLSEFKTLKGKMDAYDPTATTAEVYMGGTADWRTDLYASRGTLMTHAESIALFQNMGVKMTPELKTPSVGMPYNGDFTQAAYAQKLIDEYRAAGVEPADVFVQSFLLDDIQYWIENEPEFASQAVYLDDRYDSGASNDEENSVTPEQMVKNPELLEPSMSELATMGVKIIAPPMWTLLTIEDGEIVPSAYAKAANDAGLDIITWTLERSGPLVSGGGWYYQSTNGSFGEDGLINNDGDMLKVLDVLAQDVGVLGVFSDWPSTTTYYASCMGMQKTN